FDRAHHVNGSVDVAFDTVNEMTYNTSSGPVTYDMTVASFDPATRTCSNVGCHITETKVTWGLPYRWYDYGQECDRCHGFY
ncbi:MAG: CxxxxCH/CxxCH domain-containing protein, partial [Deltaproteobacteria bacterium]|nr:CxxxxCH/CxxCH domain-containing protein [Deltaproteobacteria bacterium]